MVAGSATPPVANAQPGTTASYTVSVSGAGGFTGTSRCPLAGLTRAQASWTFDPPAAAGGTGTGTAQLTVTPAAGIAPGSHPMTVTGASGAITHQAPATLTVPAPPDFTLAASR